MSQRFGSPQRSHRTEGDQEHSPQEILGALEDDDCRRIVETVCGETRSVKEISRVCDLALSTTYRKVEDLETAGLLEEQTQIRRSGKHTSEYRARDARVNIEVTDDGMTFELSDRSSSL